MVRHYLAVAGAALTFLAGGTSADAQATTDKSAAAANPLTSVRALKCTFPVSAAGTWENGEATAQVRRTGILTFQFNEIDTQESTANVAGLTSSSHIVAQLSGWNLHFLDIRPTGSLAITTVFGQESREKKLKAVHTRTDYLPVSIPGFVARPDVFQYYGDCEVVR